MNQDPRYQRAVARALRSKAFHSYRLMTLVFKVVNPLMSTHAPASTFAEEHFSPSELAALWHLSAETVRILFEKEQGVLIVGNTNSYRKRKYRTFRIPRSVAARVHERLLSKGKV